ncbi:hypothetical protein EHW99_3263 [Erwinia amylovora]|uniref:Uncharacterized protein n=2 Tax=Erwinia amylovora TaxID=552 RepID=A0A831A0Q1_ERWAM|nr:hypothetical protein EaACW_0319 [Erwinia amylovora ACW56400]QJQ55962.1 hypothetical protein EHX00_3263 [Erwinia amylovora]CBA19255.1 hypothetical protein predicted by Glimmer/Critica [Erwinia amylovora CFBP1430]CCO77164.1 hypothetical protein BN432_0329 [Erwinia amylovora Ea356]CCO80946.1 hypothetical protein BN433_0337 [Erwinia amylovora Ea266]CCO84751.1 hypothetical protein BN434_0326 [Erwinia amylovora CFBP 2585]CCO88539.1 hypothetical protein BN435_0329 [Erwinia amylovora 01SFR-BO]CCO
MQSAIQTPFTAHLVETPSGDSPGKAANAIAI